MPRPRLALLLTASAVCVAVGCGAKEEPAPTPAEMKANLDAFQQTLDERAGRPTNRADAEPAEKAEPAAEPVSARLPGTYTRQANGTRTLTVSDDGTAVMVVDVEPFYQWMVGERITVQIEWELTGNPNADQPGVHFESVSGTPESSFNTVTQLFGSERDWVIRSADDESLVLFSANDGEVETWTRLPADPVPADDAG